VHDTNASKSLLGLLDIKEREYCDTSDDIPEDIIKNKSELTLIRQRKDKKNRVKTEVIARLDHFDVCRFIDFDSWWGSTVVTSQSGDELTRKDIVIALANKAGGVHIEKTLKLPRKYRELTKENSLNWYEIIEGGYEVALNDPVKATIRCIAHELLKSLIPGYECTHRKAPKGIHEIIVGPVSATSKGTEPSSLTVKTVYGDMAAGASSPPTSNFQD
jgi:hypothetical protein